MKPAYFLADTHLHGTVEDRAHERRVCSWLEHIAATGCSELWLLGDILDYWYEYRTVVPRGHVRLFGALARMADAGIPIHYIVGNHDIWLRDYLRDEIGLEVLDGVIERRIQDIDIVMAHGDGIGPQKRGFRLIRGVFRNHVAQKMYSGIHPRWTIPFARAWSGHSRATGGWRSDGDGSNDPVAGAVEGIAAWCVEYCHAHNPAPRYFVMGHLHRATDIAVSGTGARLIILGDSQEKISYACLDNGAMSLGTY